MESLWQDLKYGARMLVKNPGFSAIAILTLALGIGANTAIFSVLYGVLLRPLPYPQADRLVGLAESFRGQMDQTSVDAREYRFLHDQSTIFENLAAWTSVGMNLFTGTEAERVDALRVSSNYFRTLGVQPALGREFLPEEDQPGGARVAILNHGLWMRRFGGDPGVIGRTVTLDGEPYTVVGVMSAGFVSVEPVDLWSTIQQVSTTIGSGTNFDLIGRLKPGLTIAQARAGFELTLQSLRKEFPHIIGRELKVEPFPYQQLITLDVRKPLEILFGAIGFVLLIACANVANLVLGRAASRGREMAVRVAMGATRGRLIRQLLTESLLLALAGGVLGLGVASWGLNALVALKPESLPQAADIRLDQWALLFTFGLSLLTGIVFGLVPAWQSSKADVHGALKEGSGRTTASAQHSRLRSLLVVGEVALSLVLLVGAGLLIETFANLLDTDPGFDPRPILSAEIWLTGTRYTTAEGRTNFYAALVQRIEALPGVKSAAVVEAGLPLVRGGNYPIRVEGRADYVSADYRAVTPEYFRTLGIGLSAGREFTDGDRSGSAAVAVVNEAFARRYFPNASAVGHLISFPDSTQPTVIVGVVGDVKSFVGLAARPTLFIPEAQASFSTSTIFESWFPTHVLVRAAGDPNGLRVELARTIAGADPKVPVGRVRAMEEVLGASLNFQQFLMVLLVVFAGLAIVLAAVGIYGVMSYLVTQRTHEIGVRLALGAQPGNVLRLVVGRGMALAGAGVLFGLAGALALTRLLASLLYGVKASDPATFSMVTVGLALVGVAASYIPARRAMRVDPMVALRYE